MSENEITVHLNISKEEYLQYYSGAAKKVLASAVDGRSVQFPANFLQRFVTHSGIKGYYTIYFDDKGKVISISKIA